MKRPVLLMAAVLTLAAAGLAQTAQQYLQKGNDFYKNKQYIQAITEYNQAIRLQPTAPEPWFNRGQCNYYTENYTRAIADYTQALNLRPTYVDALFQRGLSYNKNKQHDLAIADYTRGIGLAPADAQLYYNRGIAHSDKGLLEFALSDYNKALSLNPNYMKAFVNRSSVYFKQKKNDLALADINRAIQLDATYVESWNNRAVIYNTTNQPDLAIADLNKAISLDPNRPKHYLDRSVSYNKKKQNDLAIADLHRAIALDPKYVNAYVMRGAIYFDTKQYGLSRADMDKVLQLAPGNKFATDLIVRINAVPKPGTVSSALGEEQVVIDVRDAVTNAATKEQLGVMSAIVVEPALLRSLQDCNTITNAVAAFTRHATARLNGVKSPTGYKQSLLKELETVTAFDRPILEIYDRGIALVPGAETSASLKTTVDSLRRGKASMALSMASFYSLAATLRESPITLARSNAVLKNLPYDDSKDAEAYRAALADMNRAIELNPKKAYYEKRAALNSKLGNKAAAAADSTKAASLSN